MDSESQAKGRDAPPTQFMRAAQASAFGITREVLSVSPSVARPAQPLRGHVQMAVYACSLSPSDYRMLSGAADLVKRPPRWPYIPGGDVAGVVTALPKADPGTQEEPRFHVGDRIVATWDMFGIGGLAEFMNVDVRFAELLPEGISLMEGAALCDSSVNAMLAVEDAHISPGDRLLLLGGSGAVGTSVVQLAERRGAALIVATSTDSALVQSLGAHHVVDYTAAPWWSSEVVMQHAPFDVVIDCAEGVSAWRTVRKHHLLKRGTEGGRFLAVVINEWHIEMHRVHDLIGFMVRVAYRTLSAWLLARFRPRYKMLFPAPRGDSLLRLLRLVQDGGLNVVVDRGGPLPFTTDGVCEAFETMIERRAHGKVVVKIRDEE